MQTSLVATAMLLGLFILAGGCYGVLYAAGMLRSSAPLQRAAYACYVVQLLVALATCVMTPLDPLWKLFVVASGVAYGFIPPAVWRVLETMHRSEVGQARR